MMLNGTPTHCKSQIPHLKGLFVIHTIFPNTPLSLLPFYPPFDRVPVFVAIIRRVELIPNPLPRILI